MCGDGRRTIRKRLVAAVRPLAGLRYDARPPGVSSKRGRFAWGFVGWDWSVRLGRLVGKEDTFNKRDDRRYEHVEDLETGEVLHHCDHPLTEHRGHGSDKFNHEDEASG